MIENIGAIDAAATNLNSAIGKGFALDIEGAQQLLTFVKGMQTAVEKAVLSGQVLAQPPSLGSTPAANTYKSYLPTIATDPTQGFTPVMAKVKDQLDQALTNIQGSIAAYEQNDQGTAGGIVNIGQTELA